MRKKPQSACDTIKPDYAIFDKEELKFHPDLSLGELMPKDEPNPHAPHLQTLSELLEIAGFCTNTKMTAIYKLAEKSPQSTISIAVKL